MRRLPTALAVAFAATALTTLSSAAVAHDRPGVYWRVSQAASIATIRSMPVHVRECRGLGRTLAGNGARRYRHFRCLAGTRAPWERYDTIAVLYVLRPLGPFCGSRSRYKLTQVRFIGGPGIP
jgi:hypothetical protein